ncbi:MAG TPA: hypothetical protein VKA36_06735 [Solirubrobacterales bacterium]|nr:hypothetical protein [Solirubrobacterales bacterium]
MRWYLNPFFVRDAARELCELRRGGGPRAVQLEGISKPRGWIFPTSAPAVRVIAADGRNSLYEPEMPLPLPLAWGYRIARAVGAPVVSDVDPEQIELRVGWPPGRD